ncbi:hypothetical protein JNW90_10685 [Micromonospora sp. STR1s_5]|nr:hypothetical protein [Micromonospora sp. STR1s_5]
MNHGYDPSQPRDQDGRWAGSGAGVGGKALEGIERSTRIKVRDAENRPYELTDESTLLGPQGEYDSPPYWRTFSTSADARYGGDDPMDARTQIERTEENYGGLGRWYGAEELAAPYGAQDHVMVAVRFRTKDLEDQVYETDELAGLRVRGSEPVKMAVVGMLVNRGQGWEQIPVPPGLITRSHENYDDDED